jgi:hypothetical protein
MVLRTQNKALRQTFAHNIELQYYSVPMSDLLTSFYVRESVIATFSP